LGGSLVYSELAYSEPLQANEGAQANKGVRDHQIEPEDYFTISTIGSFDVSSDGKQVVYTESRWDKELDRRTSEIWVKKLKGSGDFYRNGPEGAAHKRLLTPLNRLTFDTCKQSAVAWSPDGGLIYFLSAQPSLGSASSSAKGKQQVWRMNADGTAVRQVTRAADGVVSYRLSKDGRVIYYQTTHEEVDPDWKSLREEFDKLQYGHGVNDFSRIWRLDLNSWRSEKLIDEDRVIRSFVVSPDQSKIAMQTTPDGKLISNEGWSRIDLYDAASQKIRTVTPKGWRADHPSPYGWIDGLAFSGDNRRIAFSVSFDGFSPKLYVVPAESGDLRNSGDSDSTDNLAYETDGASGTDGANGTLTELPMPGDVTLVGGSMAWRGSHAELCFLAEDHARTRVYSLAGFDGQPSGQLLTPGDVVINRFRFSPHGDHLVVYQHGLEDAGDLFAVHDDQLERLTRINPQIDSWELPQISIVQWNAPDGTSVEGILELPSSYDRDDGPLPMVVELHGGPTAASSYQFRLWIYGRALLPAQGFAVFSPNYRGSTGYGDQFLVDLVGRENDIEVQDILTGVDSMIASGIADPDRLAVMGWSNGGYLTNCLITTTDRFKAASSGAGVLDQVIQWGTEDTPGHVINYMQGLPWEVPEVFELGSPMFKLGQVSTPTIIHVGEHDARVPPAHSRALYRALKHYLDVPTELVVYPGAGHGLTTYKHRLAKMKWDLAWFEKYLGKAEKRGAAEEAGEAGETDVTEEK